MQFLSNTGAAHTPLEKAKVFRRLAESGIPRNKLRATMAIPKRQFRQVREFADAPTWLHAYGESQRRRLPVVDELGRPTRDELGALVTEERMLPALPLAHLEVLARYARRFVDWDKEQQAAHPDGEHVNVAQRTVCGIAEKAQRDSWTVERLTKRCIAAWEVATKPREATPRWSPTSAEAHAAVHAHRQGRASSAHNRPREAIGRRPQRCSFPSCAGLPRSLRPGPLRKRRARAADEELVGAA